MAWMPTVWPEVETPEEFKQCAMCQLQHQRSRVIWGEGNEQAPIAAVLDNPGAREDREGNAFVCATRGALQRTVHDVGLTQNDVFVTYLLKCRPTRKYDKEAAREACLGFLQKQLEGRKVIMLLGLVAAQTVLRMPDAVMADFRNRWHDYNGIPARVTYHPLAVHRRPNLAANFEADWRAVAEREPPRPR